MSVALSASSHQVQPLRVHQAAVPASVTSLRHAVLEYFDALEGPRGMRDAVGIAVSEACTNVVVHAYDDATQDRPVEVTAWPDGPDLVVCVSDEGRGIVPGAKSAGIGMGLPLIAQLADRFEISARDGAPGVTITMSFALTG